MSRMTPCNRRLDRPNTFTRNPKTELTAGMSDVGREKKLREENQLRQAEVVKRRRSDSNRCIKVLQTSPLPLGYGATNKSPGQGPGSSRAGHGIRTRDFDLGKVALYH